MTTGRINQVNGGTKGVWNQPFFCGHAPPIDPPPTEEANGEPNRWCLCESVASLFPPWSEGQCLAPSTDGRGPSRAHKRSTPKETRRFDPARSNEEQGTARKRAVRDEWVLAHTTDTRSRGRVRGTGDRTVQRGTARGELIARVELPGPSHPRRRAIGPRLSRGRHLRGQVSAEGPESKPRAWPRTPLTSPGQRSTKQPRPLPRPHLQQRRAFVAPPTPRPFSPKRR